MDRAEMRLELLKLLFVPGRPLEEILASVEKCESFIENAKEGGVKPSNSPNQKKSDNSARNR